MRSTALFILLFLVVSSCSLFHYKNNENILPTPAVAHQTETPFRFGSWPKEAWWEVFQSDPLSQLIAKGLQNNPSIRLAEERIEQAKQIALQKRSFLFPWLSMDFNENWIHLSKNGLLRALNPQLPITANLLDIGLSLDYTFDFWRQYRNLFEAALGETYSKEAEAKQVELVITTSIAESYFSLLTNMQRKRLYERLLTIRSDLSNLENLLKVSALNSNLPVYLANEAVEEARKAVFAIDEEIAINQHMINALIGQGPDYDPIPYTYLPEAPIHIDIPEEISLDLLARRPDLTAAIWRVEAVSHLVGASVANFFPNINIRGILGFESFHTYNLFNESSLVANLLPAFHLPIFTAGNIRAGVNEKKAEFEQAVFHYNKLLLDAVKEVSNNLIIVDTFYKKKESQKMIVDNALFRFELKNLRMQSGLDNVLEVYQEEIQWIGKRLEDLDLLYGQYFSVIELIKSLGGGYISHEK